MNELQPFLMAPTITWLLRAASCLSDGLHLLSVKAALTQGDSISPDQAICAIE